MVLRALLLLLILSPPEAHPQPGSQIRRLFRFVATDSKGQPVTDLRAEEIRVSDAGKSAPVAFSRLLPVSLPTIAPGEPGEFSNRSGNQPLSSIFVLVDLFNTDFPPESNSFHELTQALEKLESSISVWLFFLAPNADLFPVSDLPGPGVAVRALTPDQLRQALNTAEKLNHTNSGGSYDNAQRSRQALESLGAHYAALPGEKRLIWMTRGMPLAIAGPKGAQPLVFQTIVQQAAEQFRQLGIPVYTVQPKDRSSADIDRSIALGSFAALTGGRNFENEAIEDAIAQAQVDERATYLAAFYTSPGRSDGKAHQLRVSTTRRNVRILAASGYTVDPAEAIDEHALERAESQIVDNPDLALRASLSLESGTAHFRIHVDAPGILLAFVFFYADGTETATEPVRSAVNAGGPVTVDLPVPAGTKKIRIACENPLTAAVGTLTIPLS